MGTNNQATSNFTQTKGFVYLMASCILIPFIVHWCSSPTTSEESKTNQTPKTITSNQAPLAPQGRMEAFFKPNSTVLYRDYIENEINADEKYKGNYLEVKGTIIAITRNNENNIIIALGEDSYTIQTGCMFPEKEADYIKGLRVGQNTTITGKCIGLDHATPILINCYIKGTL